MVSTSPIHEKNSKIVLESNKDTTIGEIVTSYENCNIFTALVRISDVLPKDTTTPLPEIVCMYDNNENDDDDNNDNNVTNDENDVENIVHNIKNSNKCTSSVSRIVKVVPFRPVWWVDRDPLTNKRIDTHDEEEGVSN